MELKKERMEKVRNEGCLENPDHCIVLLNGRRLVCYPKSKPDSPVGDTMSLDQNKQLFLANAFLFYRNAPRIFNDSRMFLAPVPIQNGLALSGTCGFEKPTLGVYLEWWLNCHEKVTKDKDGNDALTYYLAGSPFSGMNNCSCVYPDGSVKHIHYSRFHSLFRSFLKINNRYTEAKAKYEAYPLHEVVELLSGEETAQTYTPELEVLQLEGRLKATEELLKEQKEQYRSLEEKYHQLTLQFHKKVLDEFCEEYESRRLQADLKIKSLEEQRCGYKVQLKQGEMTDVEYQMVIVPLKEKQETLEAEIAKFKYDKINEITKSGYATYSMIEERLSKKACQCFLST